MAEKTVTLTVNGTKLSAKPGEMVLPVLLRNQLKIPHFCYHPALSVAGVCRICLVEVEGSRKLEIACSLPVREGMVIRTESEKVNAGRAFVMEFTLINHPLDCPDCDQAGECWLQEYYMAHDRQESAFEEGKVHKDKRKVIGPRVILDQERCILCTRCVRFTDEITHTSELGILNRGDQSILDIIEGKTLDNAYSENVVDICPVGALTSRDFRFDGRVWFLKESPSICPGCAKGCNVVLHHRENKIRRILPRHNEKVNGHWMCDAGRDVYKHVHASNRLLKPFCEEGGKSVETPWPLAFQKAVELIQAWQFTQMAEGKKGEISVAAMASIRSGNEDNDIFCEFVRANFGAAYLTWQDVTPKTWPSDSLLRQADCNPNSKGAEEVVQGQRREGLQTLTIQELIQKLEKRSIRVLFVLAQDILDTPDANLKKRLAQALEKLDFFFLFDTHESPSMKFADVTFPITTFAEQSGSFTNCDGITQSFEAAINPLAEAMPLGSILPALTEKLGKGDVDGRNKKTSTKDSQKVMSGEI